MLSRRASVRLLANVLSFSCERSSTNCLCTTMRAAFVSCNGMLASTHRPPKRTFSIHNATFVVRRRILGGDGARESGSLTGEPGRTNWRFAVPISLIRLQHRRTAADPHPWGQRGSRSSGSGYRDM
jgi:hypothetical protein